MTPWLFAALVRKVPATKVLILSTHGDDEYVKAASETGAARFLLKHASAQDVCRAIREVHQGNRFNYVFCDGHVELLTMEKTLGAGTSTSKQTGMWTIIAGD